MNIRKIITSVLIILGITFFLQYCAALGQTTSGSCTESGGFCTDYIGSDFTPDGVKGSCLGEYSLDSCTSANSSGSCLIDSGQPNETKITYYTSSFADATTASGSCAGSGGTFVN